MPNCAERTRMRFDRLHWTESDIERFDVDQRTVSVIASKVFVLEEHGARRVKVTFHAVCRAELEVTAYIGSSQAALGFEEPRRIQLVPRLDARAQAHSGWRASRRLTRSLGSTWKSMLNTCRSRNCASDRTGPEAAAPVVSDIAAVKAPE